MPVIMPLTEAVDPDPTQRKPEVLREPQDPISPFPVSPADGLDVGQGYIEDPDRWFRDMSEDFDARIKHKK